MSQKLSPLCQLTSQVSDPNGVMAVPLTTANFQRATEPRKVKVRPLPESLVCKFGSQLVLENWSFLTNVMTSTEMVSVFEQHTKQLIEKTFPERLVTISERDLPFITEELKLLRRQRIRSYRKGSRSFKYLELHQKFDEKLKIEANKYHKKILLEVSEGKRNNSYTALRKLESGYDAYKCSTFTLPYHAEENLTPLQSAERLADYFPIYHRNLSPSV